MSEEEMVQLFQNALVKRGVSDKVIAVGEFNPRGHTGAHVRRRARWRVSSTGPGAWRGASATAVGSVAGMHAHDAASGLPGWMLIGVTDSTVYGFAGRRSKEPTDLVFEVPRAGLEVKVHKRVNVRVLELIDEESGSAIELEGNRLPVTHTKDVIDALQA